MSEEKWRKLWKQAVEDVPNMSYHQVSAILRDAIKTGDETSLGELCEADTMAFFLWKEELEATLVALRAEKEKLETNLRQVSLWSKASLRKIRGMAYKDVRRHHNLSDVLEDIYKEANDSVEKIRQLQETPLPADNADLTKDIPVPLKEPSPSVPIFIPRSTIKDMIRKVDEVPQPAEPKESI